MRGRNNDLQKTISRLADLILLCEQALQMIQTIADKAGEINARSLGNFFGPVQYVFFDTLVINTCTIFDTTRKYEQYSIPAALRQLRTYHIERPEPFMEAIGKYGFEATHYSSSEDLAKAYAAEIQRRTEANDIGRRLHKFRDMRNKVVAHHQANVEVKRSLNVEDARYLLSFAKDFVSAVGLALFNCAYSDDQGDFSLDEAAGRASRAANRILEHMGIIALPQQDEVRARMLARTIQEAQWSKTVKARLIELLLSDEE